MAVRVYLSSKAWYTVLMPSTKECSSEMCCRMAYFSDWNFSVFVFCCELRFLIAWRIRWILFVSWLSRRLSIELTSAPISVKKNLS